MKTKILTIVVSLLALSAVANFTEFYCISGAGANTNGGGTATATATYATVNGNWDGSAVFTPTDSSTPASSVNVGDFAAVFLDGGTNATYVARVTTVAAGANGAITLSTAAACGTAPSGGSSGRTLTVGGAWGGPTLIGDSFPFSFTGGSLTNSSGNSPRVNCKGTWYATNPIVDACNLGTVWFQGYTNTIADGGFANIYGSNNIAGYALHSVNGKNRVYRNFLWATNGNSQSSTQHLLSVNGTENLIYECAAHDARLAGFFMQNANTFKRLEAWNCDLANSAGYGAIMPQSAGCITEECFAHDNTGANAAGFETDGTQVAIRCISVNNGGPGYRGTGDVQLTLMYCDSFSNGGAGLLLSGASGTMSPIDNMCLNFIGCNFIKNAKCGITNDAGAVGYYNGVIENCGFGSGTMANGNGDIEGKLQGVIVINKITYPSGSFPWVATNNFLVSLAQAKDVATNTWLNVSGLNYVNTVGYADVGAAAHLDSGTGSPVTTISAN